MVKNRPFWQAGGAVTIRHRGLKLILVLYALDNEYIFNSPTLPILVVVLALESSFDVLRHLC